MQPQPFVPPGSSKLKDKPTKADTATMMDNLCKWIMQVGSSFALLSHSVIDSSCDVTSKFKSNRHRLSTRCNHKVVLAHNMRQVA